jgi:hypothetical protein
MQKVYPDGSNHVVIVCPICGVHRTVDASPYLGRRRQVRVRCSCTEEFFVLFEERKHYRKSVNLRGVCFRPVSPGEPKPISVSDVSRGGMRFRADCDVDFQPEELLGVRFVLDDPSGSNVVVNTRVKRVDGREISVEYCGGDLPRALRFYLMP